MKRSLLRSSFLSAFTLSCVFTPVALQANVDINQGPVALKGTIYEEPAISYGLDPLLLYSVALAESAWEGDSPGQIQPWPYTLRVASLPGNYQQSLQDALRELRDYEKSYQSIDIGMMQVNSKYHGHRVNSLSDLLVPETNLDIGAQILRETIDSAPGDLQLGIGRYHHWADEIRARSYGSRILAIYNNLRSILY